MSLLVRPADPAEAADLQRLVRVTSLPPVDAEYVGSRHVFVAHEGNQLAGFFALHAGPSAWRLEHLWVAEASVGRGRGRWLFTDAVRRARRLGAESLRLTPEPEAEPFFRRLGARPLETGGEMEVDVTAWMEPLPDSVSELGTAE